MKKLIYVLLTICFVLINQNIYAADILNMQEHFPPDTIHDRACVLKFPHIYLGDTIQQPGTNNYFSLKDSTGQDSVIIHLSVYKIDIDTIRLADCSNNFPLDYDGFIFSGTTTQTLSHETSAEGCPIYHFFDVTSNPLYQDTVNVSICAVDTPYAFHDTTFVNSGQYIFRDTTLWGCDSITVLNLIVHPTYNIRDTLTATACVYELPYMIGDSSFTEAGEYDIIQRTIHGCDSASIHLNLTIQQISRDTLKYNVCSNDYPLIVDENHQYDTAGVYSIFHPTDQICSNITTVIIQELPAYDDTLHVNWCAVNGAYTFADSNFTVSTIYTLRDTTALGCDSITTLVLNVGTSYTDTITDTLRLCANDLPYTFSDTTITSAGTYELDLQTILGCDSSHLILSVYVEELPKDTVSISVCNNNFPYWYWNNEIPSAGAYDLLIPNLLGDGCDTLRHLTVEAVAVPYDTIAVTLCSNTPYVIGNTILTMPGVYDFILPSSTDCDSMVNITLSHYPIYDQDTLTVITHEHLLPYVFGDTALTTSGTHRVVLETVNGCDSVITINLTIRPVVINADTIFESICQSQMPYTTNFGEIVTEVGLHSFITNSSIEGVDSVFYYKLTLYDKPFEIRGNEYLCDGNTTNLTVTENFVSYAWNTGDTLQVIRISQANTYTVTVTDSYGCQSSASHTILSAEAPTIVFSETSTICYGDSVALSVSGADHYLWANGSTNDTIWVSPTQNTEYHFTAYSAESCMQEGFITVIVNSLPEISIVGRDTICQGDSTVLLAHGGVGYRWSNQSVNDTAVIRSEGFYTVTVTDGNQCVNTAVKYVHVHALPNIVINGRSIICFGNPTTLTAIGASTYQWDTGESTSSISTAYANTYSVTGTDIHGCSSVAEKQVSIMQINAEISGSRHFCQGEHTTLKVVGSEEYVCRWSDGSSNDSLDVSSAGQYSVQVTNALGCTNTITATVSEYTLPTANITGSTTICQGRSTIIRATGGTQYLWENGSTNAYLSVTETGTYYVTVTNQHGCSASTSETIIVHPLPEVSINTQNSICQGSSVSLYAQSPTGVQYIWPMNGQQGQLITTTPTSTTSYTVNVTDDNGCTNSASALVVVNSNPTVYLNGPTSICQGDTATFTATGGTSYLWNNGNTSSSYTTSRSGSYTVTGFNDHGCSSTITTNLTINSLPNVTFTPDTSICQGKSVTLVASASSDHSYVWSNGVRQSNNTVNQAGTYTVTVTNNITGCSRAHTINVSVNSNPTVNVSGNTSFCTGGSSTLYVTASSGCTYIWGTGEQNTLLQVTAAGTYTVTATDNNGCSNSASIVVTENSNPTISLHGPTSICQGDTATFTVSGGVSYLWHNGSTNNTLSTNQGGNYSVTAFNAQGCSSTTSANLSVTNLPNVTFTPDTAICQGKSVTLIASASSGHSYVWSNGIQQGSNTVSQAGSYTVTVTNDGTGCSRNHTINVSVNNIPSVSLTGNTVFCTGGNSTLHVNTSNGCTYIWATGEQNMPLQVTSDGTYTVTVTDNNGCTNTASAIVTTHALPVPTITGNTTICRGSNSVLTAGGGATYTWSTGATGSNISVSPLTNTTYMVTATNEYGCTASTNVLVTVNTLPTLVINGVRSFCEGDTTTLTATGASTYTWSTGATTAAVNISEPGLYFVTAHNSFNCERTDSVRVVELNNPVVAISGNSLVCENTPHTLIATGASSYEWSTNETGDTIVISPNATTSYSVTGVDANGCQSSVNKVVNVEATPNVVITGNTTICQGENTTLTATGGNSYLWDNGSESNQIISGNAGIHSVTATSSNGCTATATAQIIVNPIPHIILAGPTTLCENTSSNITAIGGDFYHWNNGSNDEQIIISQAGTYTVTGTNTFGCSSIESLEVTSLAMPSLIITGSDTICEGNPTTISAISSAVTYAWSTGDTSITITVNPIENTSYSVTATAENGCSKSENTTIIVNPIFTVEISDQICQGTAYIQNGFNIPVQQNAGEYTFSNTLQSIHGCDSTIILHLTVNPLPLLPETITGYSQIATLGSYLYQVEGAQFVNDYQWRISNTHWELSNSNSNSVYLDITQNGNGLLTAKAINECGTAEISINISCNVGVEEYTNKTNILLYPVPVQDILIVDITNANIQAGTIQIVDQLGKCLQNIPVTDLKMRINCTTYAAGHYFIRILDRDGKTIDTRKIIISK